jgi:hypothetical protein
MVYVVANPGTIAVRAAEAIGPHGSRQYGYRTIDRALIARRIRAGGCTEAGCERPSRSHRHLFIQ